MSQKLQRKYTKYPANDKKVILENSKVFVPQNLHLRIIEWYYHWLCHLGPLRMYKTTNAILT